jgi:hypothetical protein
MKFDDEAALQSGQRNEILNPASKGETHSMARFAFGYSLRAKRYPPLKRGFGK